jgi:hypothetical protein
MNYVLTTHAKRRLNERGISRRFLEEALRTPTKILYDENGRLMVKKLYVKGNRERLLLIIGEVLGNKLKIITIIDTSKVRKYL